jgi:probable rRNA maturation factor
MEIIFVNESKAKWPKKYMTDLLAVLVTELKKRKVRNYKKIKPSSELSLVFLSKSKAKKLNLLYRNKNYATDVLSFLNTDTEDDIKYDESLGDLVICPEVIKKQAKEHGLSFNQELAYMIIHGILHLLGYDHEKNPREEKIMLDLQDKIFERLVT